MIVNVFFVYMQMLRTVAFFGCLARVVFFPIGWIGELQGYGFIQRLQVKKFIWMFHYFYSSENIEIKRRINRHFTLVYFFWVTRLP